MKARGANSVGSAWHKTNDGAIVVFHDGRFPSVLFDNFRVRYPGQYRVRLKGYAYQSQKPVTVGLYVVNRGRDSQFQLQDYYAFPTRRTEGDRCLGASADK
jgi:hypothetical protein